MLRGANADLNMTFAMSMIFFAVLDYLGVPGEWPWWVHPAHLRAER